ncbi:MAG TPA: hypothetical protein VHB21_19800 [Minicystis sp.]|nr:hypothetical protein [Minicystis sp.]
MRKLALAPSFALFLLAGCGGSSAPAQAPGDAPPPAEGSADMGAPPPTSMAVASAAPSAAPAVDLTPLDKPKSKWAVGAASVSDVDKGALMDAMKKAGWGGGGVSAGGTTVGKYESVTVELAKGKTKGTLTIVRPAAKPAPPSSMTITPPAQMEQKVDKATTAFVYDPDADVFVSVEINGGGKAADAKKLLDAAFKKGK